MYSPNRVPGVLLIREMTKTEIGEFVCCLTQRITEIEIDKYILCFHLYEERLLFCLFHLFKGNKNVEIFADRRNV